MKTKILFIVTLLLFFSCSKEHIKPLKVKRNFSGSLWIVRHQISSPEKIDSLVDIVYDSDVKNIFVQVRGRGDSYYSSDFEQSGHDVAPGFDPLKYLLKRLAASDIKVHAWINVSLVLNPGEIPPPEWHILSKHPEWITYDSTGRAMTDYSKEELKKNLLEGYFIDPAVPDVQNYLDMLVKDILAKYKVNGVHLDFIRYPYSGFNEYFGKELSDFGYNPVARELFKNNYGIDPLGIDKTKDVKNKELFDRFRQEQVTGIVKRINSTVKNTDSSLIVSAAVMPRYDRGKAVYFQDWPEWLENGYIDIACIMSYASKKSVFDSYIDYAKKTGNNDKIFMGVQVKKNTPLKIALEQIKATYDNNLRGYILFSYEHDAEYINNLNSLINYKKQNYKY